MTTTTAERLQREALRLFTSQGYRATTVEQIAAAAGVSHMTFFRHFPTKESVVVSDPYDPEVARAVAATDPALPPLERARQAIGRAWAALPPPTEEETMARISLVAGEPTLRAAMWEANQRTLEAMAEALVVDGVDHHRAEAAAGACLGAVTAALLAWGRDGGAGPLSEALALALEVLDPTGGRP